MANLGDLGGISGTPRFQGRVAAALAQSAANVYSESSFAATNASTAAGSKLLAFAAVPSWVGIGGGIVDLSNTTVIPQGAIITGVTATSVTLDLAVATGGVASGDVISFTQHAARASFANRIGTGNYQIQPICYAVLGNATIAAEAAITTLPDFAIADSDIQFSVNSLWNMLAGA